MWEKGLGFLLCCWISTSAFSQTLRIINRNEKPISDVFIYHDKRSYTATTDSEGRADVSHFPIDGYFHFQHQSFEAFHLRADSLKKLNYSVRLIEKLIWFNELVVAASKWEQDEKDISQQITSIDRKSIANNDPATSADMLAQSGQVFVQKSQLGGGSPKLRGFSANAVLIVVDGVRMNNAIYRSGNLQNVINIDPNALASSEVVFGPGSVIYGSDALGGVMDFHTVSPLWNQTGTQTKANLMTRYGSAASEHTIHSDVSVARRKFTYFGSATRTWMDDLQSGSNRSGDYDGYFLRENYAVRVNSEDAIKANRNPNLQVGTGFDLINVVQKFKFLLNQHTDLSYNFYLGTTSDIPRYDRLAILKGGTDSLEYAEWKYGPQVWNMHMIQLNHFERKTMYDQLKLTTAYQRYEETRHDRRFGNDWRRTQKEGVDILSVNLDLDKQLKKGDLFYGAEFVTNEVASSAWRQNIGSGTRADADSRYPDGGSTYSSLAVYANRINRFHEKWTFNLGARYSQVILNANRKDEIAGLSSASTIKLSNGAMNGSVGLIHLPNDRTKLSMNLSTGFRSPNVDDVGKLFEFDEDENGMPIILVPNEDLKPEYVYNGEISLARKAGPITINLVAFYSILTDPILRGDFEINGSGTIDLDHDQDSSTPEETHGIVAQVNAESAWIAGYSAQMNARLSDRLVFYGHLNYSDGRETESNKPLRHTTPLFGKSGFRWVKERTQLDVYTEFNGHRWRDDIPGAEIEDKPYLYTSEGSPGWVTLNIKSTFDIGSSIRANLGIENILDVHYRPYSSGISAPGRNFIIGLTGKF